MHSDSKPIQRRAAVLDFDPAARSALVDIDRTARGRRLGSKPGASSRLLRFPYWLYERRLLHQLARKPLPRHIGIILDGNRRYARHRGLGDPRQIYQCGADKLNDVLDWCAELAIPAITLWVFSTENLKRMESEVAGILAAIESKIAALADDPFTHEKRIRVRAIGRLDILPESLMTVIRAAEAATANYDSMALTIAAAYGGREEIVDAVGKFLKEQAALGVSLSDVIRNLTPDAIASHLYAADLPEPDLIIRTSGEIRSSGFLLWQSVHSELYFTDVLWPAFRKIDFLRAIRDYQGRNRRFGR